MAEKLTLTLESGEVVIKLRPDLVEINNIQIRRLPDGPFVWLQSSGNHA